MTVGRRRSDRCGDLGRRVPGDGQVVNDSEVAGGQAFGEGGGAALPVEGGNVGHGGDPGRQGYNPTVPAAGGYVPPPGNNSNGSGAGSSVNQAAGLIHEMGGTLDSVLRNPFSGKSHSSSCWAQPGACASNWFNHTMHVDTSSPDYLIGRLELSVLLAVPTNGLGDAGAVADIADSDGLLTDILRLFKGEAKATDVGGATDREIVPYYPSNNGFAGKPTTVTLPVGTRIDRYGSEGGKFTSPEGTPYFQRSLPPGSDTTPYSVYELTKPLRVQSGPMAPYFNQVGGGYPIPHAEVRR